MLEWFSLCSAQIWPIWYTKIIGANQKVLSDGGGWGWGGGGYPIVNLNEQVKKRQACFRPEITIFCSFTSLRVIVKVKWVALHSILQKIDAATIVNCISYYTIIRKTWVATLNFWKISTPQCHNLRHHVY